MSAPVAHPDLYLARLQMHAEVLSLWRHRFDTHEIASLARIPEHVAAAFVARFQDNKAAGARA